MFRCGQGLAALYNAPEFQSFINCVPIKEFLLAKDIYQPGCLRKVYESMYVYNAYHNRLLQLSSTSTPSKLSDIVCYDYYSNSCSLEDLLLQDNCSSVQLPSLNTTVIDYGAVISQNGKLANKGDYIQFLLEGTVSCTNRLVKENCTIIDSIWNSAPLLQSDSC